MSDHAHEYEGQPLSFRGELVDVCIHCGMSRQVIERQAATPRLDMTHHGCGGFLTSHMGQGIYNIYTCEKCGAELIAEPPLGALARRNEREAAARAAHEERMRTWVPPEPDGRELTSAEAALCDEYSTWSEDRYAAGFMSPSESTVREFMRWRYGERAPRMGWAYEVEMLDMYAQLLPEFTHTED